tara:strand:- start:558 stop:821 length:264 start_codon:yes stop_codon:yes gene_type:complete
MSDMENFAHMQDVALLDTQFRWKGDIYECTELWNTMFQTKHDYRVFKASEFRWLMDTHQYDVMAQRLHGIGDVIIDPTLYKKITLEE